mmetsp:Transcript_3582/g.8140  ORF Transcript_3582/g.8140 Transcript_3582/m.8140 type:complete len:109 (-) Transcript_3582:80-406(-)
MKGGSASSSSAPSDPAKDDAKDTVFTDGPRKGKTFQWALDNDQEFCQDAYYRSKMRPLYEAQLSFTDAPGTPKTPPAELKAFVGFKPDMKAMERWVTLDLMAEQLLDR